MDQSLKGLDEDREAERSEEDGIDEGAENFRPHPAVGVLSRVPLRYLSSTRRNAIIIIIVTLLLPLLLILIIIRVIVTITVKY